MSGSISPAGDTDLYSFTASAGEGFQLRLADIALGAFVPEMMLFSPTNVPLATTWSNSVAAINMTAATSGTYTLLISDRIGTGTGSYDVHYTRMPGANEGGLLVNDGVVSAAIDLGDLDSYTFTVNANENFQLRLADTGATSFVPEMRLYSPTGAPLTTTWANSVAAINETAATTGTYTLVVADRNASGTGTYNLYYDRLPGANEGGLLVNDGVVSAVIDLGDLDSYTFTANANENVQLRLADTGATALVPEMRLYSPTGALLNLTWANSVAAINFTAATTGTYTLVVADRNATGTGNYDLYYVRLPGANEGGALINGGVRLGTIDLGDLDAYTFAIDANQTFQIRLVDTNGTTMVPEMRLYSPTGALLNTTWANSVAAINSSAATTGTYTLVVADRNATGTGDYDIYFTLRPGANEGGTLNNGGVVSGFLDLGDLDSYTFPASANESFQLRLADTGATSMVPEMRLYSPTGTLLNLTWDNNVAAINTVAASTGTYTLVVADRIATGTGAYEIYFTLMPGANEGGALVNDGVMSEAITLGDLDSYTLTLNANENIQLRLADTSATSFVPEMRLYSPTGTLLVLTWGNAVAGINHTAASTGTYTLVIADRIATGTGDYNLYYARVPGANEGGPLSNGASLSGILDLGDLDSFTLTLGAGEIFHLEVTDTNGTSMVPEMRLYSPVGVLLTTTWGNTVATINGTAGTTGIYTVVVADRNLTGVGPYGLDFTREVCVAYCPSLPNATGSAAVLTCSGDPSSSLVLTSSPVPNTTGQFFFGAMMLGGTSALGDGLRCVGGSTTRMLPFLSAGMMMQAPNTATLTVNYTAPYASGLNSTKHFQYWFRSGLATGTGSNTSNGVSITF